MMSDNEWQPIATFDALPAKKRPQFAVFYYRRGKAGRSDLPATVEFSRCFGQRTCTHWMPLPPPPSEEAPDER
jgi:hypothetical protein